MDNKTLFCELCDVPMGTEKTKAVHILGKKHQLAMHNAHVNSVKEKCSIFVSGIPNMVKSDEINEFFSTYGKIVDIYVGNRYAIIQFHDAKVAEKLHNTKVSYKGQVLLVKPRTIREKLGAKFEMQKPTENFELINSNIKNIQGFSSQMRALISMVQSDEMEVNKYMRLCCDLERVLQEIFPGCIVHPFGSTITGLGFKSSDVDIYVQIPYNLDPGQNISDVSLAAECVNKSKKLLFKYPRCFTKVCGIPKAKTPIVKCVHVATNISCDFNFKNMLGVCNSFLIKYFLSLDPKLTPLMVILKYWAKVHELSGSNGKFSNYSLCMMLIFYLQQKPICFPSVASLQIFNDCVNMQEGWNGGFKKYFEPSNLVTIRHYSIPQLLHGFFSFYASYDYGLYVICPFLSFDVAKVDFLEPELLPDSYRLYRTNVKKMPHLKVDGAVCVQDPFEHNHNLTNGVQPKTLEDFISFCKLDAELFKNTVYNPSLYRLFTEEPDTINVIHFSRNDTSCQFKIPLGKHITYVQSLLPDNCKNKDVEIRKAWFDLINKFTISLLLNVFKFDMTVKESRANKSQKMDGQSDVHDNVVDKVTFCCVGNINLWEARKSIMRDIPNYPEKPVLDYQIAVTDYICNVLYKGIQFKDPIVDFDLTLEANIKPTEMHFTIQCNNSKKDCFKTMAVHFAKRIPQMFENHVQDLKREKINNAAGSGSTSTTAVSTNTVGTNLTTVTKSSNTKADYTKS